MTMRKLLGMKHLDDLVLPQVDVHGAGPAARRQPPPAVIQQSSHEFRIGLRGEEGAQGLIQPGGGTQCGTDQGA
jgi:hypothetical protein